LSGATCGRDTNPEDPTSWAFQAAIHGSRDKNGQWPWNQCKHASWFFLPWHRMYVWYFEQIVRAAVVQQHGSADWALPYWNYGLGGQEATLPQAFRAPQVNNATNPLYVAARADGMNDGTGSIPPDVGVPAQALQCASFEGPTQTTPPEFGGGPADPTVQFSSWTGVLENTPHNIVHDLVGGQGLMSDPDTAAQDPIFWLHHANVDRIWNQWANAAATHKAPTEGNWTSQSFRFFDANGAEVSLTCAEVVVLAKQLDYEYAPPLAARPAPARPRRPFQEAAVAAGGDGGAKPTMHLVGGSHTPTELAGSPEQVTVDIDERASQSMLSAAGVQQPRRVFLTVQEIESERDPGTPYGIYVNLPDGAPPDTAASHYAGSLSFFGATRARHPKSDEPPHSLTITHDITNVVRALTEQGAWDGRHVTVTFRPIGLVPQDQPNLMHASDAPSRPHPPVTIGRVSIFYA